MLRCMFKTYCLGNIKYIKTDLIKNTNNPNKSSIYVFKRLKNKHHLYFLQKEKRNKG